MRGRVATVVLVSLLGFGCKKAPTELAPIRAGDTFRYTFNVSGPGGDSVFIGTLTVGAGASKDTLSVASQNDNTPPTEVDLALDAGRCIKNYYVCQLWLPPAARVVGRDTRAGRVMAQETWDGFSVFKVESQANKAAYYYDTTTGFLVGYNLMLQGGRQSSRLTQTTAQGLVVR